MREAEAFEMVVGGAYNGGRRGVVVYGPFVGSLPAVGAPLVLVRNGEPPVRVECIGIEDIRRSRDQSQFGLRLTGVDAESIGTGDQIWRSD